MLTANTIGSTVSHSYRIPLGDLPLPGTWDCFGRDELIEEIVRLAGNLEPIALIGAGGIGKTSIALKVLRHNRIEERFGTHCRFIRCDQSLTSRAHLVARLSKVIGARVENPEDLTPLRPVLSAMLIVLDSAESILDPKGANAEEIYSVVDELSRFKTMCLLITSRIKMVPPRCRRLEIPPLSMEAARDTFYSIYGDERRSRIINNLLRRLDFHALSITLLATTASHNGWDYDRLAKEWDTQRVQVLQTDHNKSLAATIELSITSPTFSSLGPEARELLGVVAFFPQGIDENNLDWLLPTISNRKNIFDKFCLLSLTYRSNGFITIWASIRDYLIPQDPRSSPLLCATKDLYFSRLSVDVHPNKPGFREAQWIVLEDVNVEHLLDVFTSLGQDTSDSWGAPCRFMEHLYWHKPRETILRWKIETLPDDHPSKPNCLFGLSQLFQRVWDQREEKRLLTHTLELERRRGDDIRVIRALRGLADANRLLYLDREGIQQAKEALEISERIGDMEQQIQCLGSLAWLFLGDRQLDLAENTASHAINLTLGKGKEYDVCELHWLLGEISRSKGEKEKAIHHFETTLRIASPFDWHIPLFWTHYSLADLFFNQLELDDANAHLQQAWPHTKNYSYLVRAAQIHPNVQYHRGRLYDSSNQPKSAFRPVGEGAETETAAEAPIYQSPYGAYLAASVRPIFQFGRLVRPSDPHNATDNLNPLPNQILPHRPTRKNQGKASTYDPKPLSVTHPVDSDTPAWKSLISRPLTPSDVISLIGMIFISKDEVKTVFNLRGNDAQAFVDVIHEVCFVSLLSSGTI